jgi:hypothetical protein
MGDQAYDPNPVKIKAGNTVTWTNDDSQIHTVTSGTGSDDTSPGKEFDSSMLSQNQTFLPQIRRCWRVFLLLSTASNHDRKSCRILDICLQLMIPTFHLNCTQIYFVIFSVLEL